MKLILPSNELIPARCKAKILWIGKSSDSPRQIRASASRRTYYLPLAACQGRRLFAICQSSALNNRVWLRTLSLRCKAGKRGGSGLLLGFSPSFPNLYHRLAGQGPFSSLQGTFCMMLVVGAAAVFLFDCLVHSL